jgi:hypothetical protein
MLGASPVGDHAPSVTQRQGLRPRGRLRATFRAACQMSCSTVPKRTRARACQTLTNASCMASAASLSFHRYL